MSSPEIIAIDKLPIHLPYEIIGYGNEAGAIASDPTTLVEQFLDERALAGGSSPTEQQIEELRKAHALIGESILPRARGDQTTESLGLCAAEKALETSGIDKESIGVLIFATSTPSLLVPEAAKYIHDKLELSRYCHSFTISNACQAGFDAEVVAASLLQSMPYRTDTALVVAADVLRSTIGVTADNPQDDFNPYAIFSDMAASLVIRQHPDMDSGLILAAPVTDSSGISDLTLGKDNKSRIKMNAPRVGAITGRLIGASYKELIDLSNPRLNIEPNEAGYELDISPTKLVVAHQPTVKMLQDSIVRKQLSRYGITIELVPIIFNEQGNPSAANYPGVLSKMLERQKIQKGDVYMAVSAAVGGTALSAFKKH